MLYLLFIIDGRTQKGKGTGEEAENRWKFMNSCPKHIPPLFGDNYKGIIDEKSTVFIFDAKIGTERAIK